MTDAPFIYINRTVFPVLALHPEEAGQAARPDFFGTAFAVAPGVFMTAAHVVTEAALHGQPGVGGPAGDDGRPMGAVRVHQYEVWAERDIALLYTDVADVTLLKLWLTHRVQVLTDLSAFGYPHAVTSSLTGDRLNVVFRAYKGHVITVRGFDRLPHEPSVYEVSCPFPQGMSGSPVLLSKDDALVVVGVVLGVDTVIYGGIEQRVGIALVADEIVDLHSVRLGGTLGERLGIDGAVLMVEQPDTPPMWPNSA